MQSSLRARFAPTQLQSARGYPYAYGYKLQSRKFTAANGQGLYNPSSLTTNSSLNRYVMMSAWFKPTATGLTSSRAIAGFASATDTTGATCAYLMLSAGRLVAYQSSAGGAAVSDCISPVGAVVQDGWNFAIAMFNGYTSRVLWLRNSNGIFTATGSASAGNSNDECIPNVGDRIWYNGATWQRNIWPFDGLIADVAIWPSPGSTAAFNSIAQILLNPYEINGMAGHPPASLIYPQNLTGYWPLLGRDQTVGNIAEYSYTNSAGCYGWVNYIVGASNITASATNNPTVASDRPPVLYPPGTWASTYNVVNW